MKPFRVAVGSGALATLVLFARSTAHFSSDLREWLLLTLSCLGGGLFIGGFVLAWRGVRRTPRAGPIVAALLMIPSAVIVRSWYQDHIRVIRFLATADSTRGRIKATMDRGGVLFAVDYQVNGHVYSQLDRPASLDAHRVVGDSIWLYYQPQTPQPAHMSRPATDNRTPVFLLASTWLVGISGLLGYGSALAHQVLTPDNDSGAT